MGLRSEDSMTGMPHQVSVLDNDAILVTIPLSDLSVDLGSLTPVAPPRISSLPH